MFLMLHKQHDFIIITICIYIGGDQLTVARTRSCQRIRSNSTRGRDRLEGFVPCIEDWHAKVSFLGVSILFYYLSSKVCLYMPSYFRLFGSVFTSVHREWTVEPFFNYRS